MNNRQPTENPDPIWVQASSLTALKKKSPVVCRLSGKQIVLFRTENGIRACNNGAPTKGIRWQRATFPAGAR